LRALRGKVRLYPDVLSGYTADIDAGAAHRWSPLAPIARVEAHFTEPGLRWSGPGYLDSNTGAAPIEDAFSGWTWSRASTRGGTAVLYDLARRDGTEQSLAIHIDRDGRVEPFPAPAVAPLPSTLWRIPRVTRADPNTTPRVLKTLEDTPFYARSVLATHLMGEPVVAMHESLSLDRFRRRGIQWLLACRMPRHPLRVER
jgi:carotenoid 1,2-hydratase